MGRYREAFIGRGGNTIPMAQKRVPLVPDDEDDPDDEPLVTSADEIRAGIDRSHLPDEPERREDRARDRARQEGTAGGGGGQEDRPRTSPASSDDVEEEAVQRLVAKLREKGKSEQFIAEHMDTIREKALNQLYGQERR